jgi:membrane protein
MAISHQQVGKQVGNRVGNKRELIASLIRLVAALSIWQLRRRSQARNESVAPGVRMVPMASMAPMTAQAADFHFRKEAVAPERVREKPAAPAKEKEDLRTQSYPKAVLHIAIAAAKAWSSHRAASKGAALALYTLFSLAPMLVLVVTLAGFVFGEDAVRQTLLEQMSGLMGSQGGDAVKTILAGGQHKSDGFFAGLISAALVLVSATSAFAELKDSLDELWEVPPSNSSGIWHIIRERFLSFGLILVLVLMLLASLSVSTALGALGGLLGGADSPFRIVSLIITNLVSFLVVTGLFAVIFKYLPAVKIAWKDVFVGSLLTALLFTIGKSLIGLYVGHADINSSYGAAGSVVILITWIYYSAQIFFYGSLFTHEYAMKLGSMAGNAPKQ